MDDTLTKENITKTLEVTITALLKKSIQNKLKMTLPRDDKNIKHGYNNLDRAQSQNQCFDLCDLTRFIISLLYFEWFFFYHCKLIGVTVIHF